jgi:hypothetical protein
MTTQIEIDALKKPLLKCLDETFSSVHGIYLDKGTTLFETIDGMTAAEASEKISPNSATIAAQIEHLRFYLDVLDDYIHKHEVRKVNWRDVWETVSEVDEEQWSTVKTRLRDSHAKVMSTINSFEKWDGEYDIAGALSILTHTAYHLGGIRVALGAVRSKAQG